MSRNEDIVLKNNRTLSNELKFIRILSSTEHTEYAEVKIHIKQKMLKMPKTFK